MLKPVHSHRDTTSLHSEPNATGILRCRIDASLFSDAAFDALADVDANIDLLSLATSDRDGTYLVVNSPDLVRAVLVGNHRSFRKGPEFQRIKMLTGAGVIVSDGDVWRSGRKILQPTFVTANWDVFQSTVDQEADALMQRWVAISNHGGAVDLLAEAEHFALSVMIRAIFSDEAEAFRSPGGGWVFDMLKSETAKSLSVAAQVHGLRLSVLEMVQRRAASPGARRDILALMLQARDKSAPDVSDRALVDEIVTLIVAGFETSAILLGWAWFLSGRDPGCIAWLRGGAGTLDARITSLAYECLRLYPPVWMFTRRAVQPVTLGAMTVDTDQVVAISPYLLHRRSDVWDTPDTFDAARFMDLDDRDPRWRAFIPFSAGPRRCIGDVFSDYEIRAVMSRLLDKVRIVPAAGQDIALSPMINLRSRTPLRANLHPVMDC